MNAFDRFADWIIRRAKRTPYIHLAGYMFRWWLLPYTWWRPAVRVHEIISSDDDRAFHDHPWPFLSIILKGGYTEVRPIFDKSGLYVGDTRKFYGPGSVLFRRASAWHRLEVAGGQVATTLFITGRYRRRWGFLVTPAAKLYHADYLKQYGAPTYGR